MPFLKVHRHAPAAKNLRGDNFLAVMIGKQDSDSH